MAEANEEGSLSLIDFTEVEVAEGPLNLALTSLYFFLLVSFWCLLFRHIMRWPIRAQKKTHKSKCLEGKCNTLLQCQDYLERPVQP